MADEAHGHEQFEAPGVRTRPVLLFALAAVALVVASIWMLAGVYQWQVPNRVLPPPEVFPLPRVQTHQAEQREQIEAEQRRRLTGYHWEDRNKGLLRIPIERAMQLIAQRGADAYAPLLSSPAALASPSAGAQRAVTPGQGPSGEPAPQPGAPAASGPGASGQPGGSPAPPSPAAETPGARP
jgi:hypothetical protein